MNATWTVALCAAFLACSEGAAPQAKAEPDVIPGRFGGPLPWFRWRSWGAEDGIRFRAGEVDVHGQGATCSPLEDGGLVVTVTSGEWYETTTLFLVLDRTPSGWRGRSVGLWASGDVLGQQHWIVPLSGTVTVQSSSCDPDAAVRCDVDLDRFHGTFEIVPKHAVNLAEWLRAFAGAPAAQDG